MRWIRRVANPGPSDLKSIVLPLDQAHRTTRVTNSRQDRKRNTGFNRFYYSTHAFLIAVFKIRISNMGWRPPEWMSHRVVADPVEELCNPRVDPWIPPGTLDAKWRQTDQCEPTGVRVFDRKRPPRISLVEGRIIHIAKTTLNYLLFGLSYAYSFFLWDSKMPIFMLCHHFCFDPEQLPWALIPLPTTCFMF